MLLHVAACTPAAPCLMLRTCASLCNSGFFRKSLLTLQASLAIAACRCCSLVAVRVLGALPPSSPRSYLVLPVYKGVNSCQLGLGDATREHQSKPQSFVLTGQHQDSHGHSEVPPKSLLRPSCSCSMELLWLV